MILVGTPIVRSEFIYEKAPFPACHASTLAETRTGELVSAWFGGTRESAPDVAIYFARHETSGWTVPEKVADGKTVDRTYPCYNPVLFQQRDGPLWLFYKVGSGPQTWWGMVMRSTNGGRSWDPPHRLPNRIFGPIKNKPIELADGTILCGSSEEDGGWRVHFEWTKNPLGSWHRTGPVNDSKRIGAIQPSILEIGKDHLTAVGRTNDAKIFSIDSFDAGHTWGTMKLLGLANPNSGTDAVRLSDGRYVLVFNDSTHARTPLNVAVSDDGEHWKNVVNLESEPGEYSYPAVIQTTDGLVHVSYTWRRKRIKHVVLDPSKF